MAGYIRQSSFSDGDTITAALFNNEYNQLLSAFSNTSGHAHDGTTAEGPVIGLIGDAGETSPNNKVLIDTTNNYIEFYVQVSSSPVQQLYIADGAIVPVTDNDIDLGTSSLEFKDAYFDGTVTTDLLTVSGTTNLDGAIQVDNTITVGVDDTGYDVKFFGDTASAYMLWDASADDLVLAGAAGLDIAGDIDVDGTSNLDNTDIDGTLAVDGTTISLDATTSLNIDNSNTSNGITIGTATSGVPVSIGHTTSEVTVNDNLTVTGTLTLGSGAELTEAELEMLDGITAGTVAASKAVVVDSNKDAASFRNITLTGELDAATLDISGDADIDGTLEADAITIGGVTLAETISDTVGAMVSSNTETNITVTYEDSDNTLDFVIGTLNQDTTGTADNITVSANNSTDETVYPIFVDGATGSQGAESDTGLTYNPSSGLLTTTLLAGTLNTAAQGNVTSLGTLTTLTVDNVIINGTTIGHTSDTDLMTLADGVLTVAGEVDATSLDISGDADIDGTLEADAITIGGVTLAETISDTVGAMVTSNTETGITVAYQDADNTLDFTIGTLNQDTTGTADNITVSANNSTDETVYPIFVDGATGSQGAESDTGLTYNPSSGNLTIGGSLTAATLDISGDVDVDGTLEADAITVNGTTLAETISDTVGAMVGSNTETGITVTYEDGDNTLDFALGAAQTTITSLLATDIKIGEDDQTKIDFETADEIHFYAANVEQVYLGDNIFGPQSDSDVDLGTTGVRWKDAYVDSITVTGEVDAASLDISGNIDVDGTANLDNTDIDGTLNTSGVVTCQTSANISQVALTSSSNATAWDAAAAANAYYATSENTTFSAPSNATEGAIISVEIAQGGTARTVAWNTVFEFAASTAPTITATANKTDILTFRYNGSVWQEIGRVQNMAQT